MLSAVTNVDIELTAVSGRGFACNAGNPGFEPQKCMNPAWLLILVLLALGSRGAKCSRSTSEEAVDNGSNRFPVWCGHTAYNSNGKLSND